MISKHIQYPKNITISRNCIKRYKESENNIWRNIKKYRILAKSFRTEYKKKEILIWEKIYLFIKNLKIKRNKKLDYKKVNLFFMKKNKINYELELSKRIKIYPVFYILILKWVNPKIPI